MRTLVSNFSSCLNFGSLVQNTCRGCLASQEMTTERCADHRPNIGINCKADSNEVSEISLAEDETRDLEEGEAKDGVVEGSGGGYDEDLVIDVY